MRNQTPPQQASSSFIPYGRQEVTQGDIDRVVAVLKSDWLTQGPAVPEFEAAMAKYCGVEYAVAVNSATSGLHMACLALGLEEGDRLWTVPNTFVASANCGRYCGATVDFVDIDPDTFNMSVAALKIKLKIAADTDALPKVVIPVHFAGQPCDMEAIYQLSKQYGFYVIEDAAHAIGGKYQGKAIGNCEFSDMTVFSFHPVKIITTAEGGMVMTNRKELYDKLCRFRSHGITREPEQLQNDPHGPWYYEQLDLGFNYRMTDLQAALGVSQLERLDQYVTRRHELVARYEKALAKLPLTFQTQPQWSYSAYHLFVVRLDLEKIGKTKADIFNALRAQNIGPQIHYIPVHTQPYYQTQGFEPSDFPNSEHYYQEALSLPLYATLSNADQDRVVEVLSESLKN